MRERKGKERDRKGKGKGKERERGKKKPFEAHFGEFFPNDLGIFPEGLKMKDKKLKIEIKK